MNKPLSGKTVLVVDDEVFLCELMADEFKLAGAEVQMAASGQQALELCKKTNFDVVISDIKMPNGTGIDLLTELRKNPGGPALMLLVTGFSDYSHSEIYNMGAEGIYSKPVDLDSIMASISRLLKPTENRYQLTGERPKAIKTPDSVVATENGQLPNLKSVHFGRGGIFIESNSNLPNEGQEMFFNIKFTKPLIDTEQFSGLGVCRWVRNSTNKNGRAGFGLEFLELDKKSIEFLEKLLKKQAIRPFIPID